MNLLPVYTTITYERVAPLLGFAASTAHPKSVECPYCGNRTWSVYLESLTMEEWCHCRHCKRAGNIIATAAAHLQLSEYDTLLYLASKLKVQFTPNTLESYRRKLVRDSNTGRFWRMCQTQSIQPEQAHRLFLNSLGCLPSDKLSIEQRSEGLSHLFGVFNRVQMNKYREPRDLLPTERLDVGQRRQSRRSVPPTMLCVPLYGNPTRVDSISTIAADRELSLNSQGLAGLPLLEQFDDSRVVLTSTLLPMLQMQVQHAGHSRIPLPMLGWKQERLTLGYYCWPILAGNELTFWDPEPTGLMLYMAKSTGARISFFGQKSAKLPRSEWISRWIKLLRTTPAIDVLAKVRQQAVPVEEAVRNWADAATPQQLTGLLQSVEYVDAETADMVYRIVDPNGTRYRSRQFRVTPYAARGHAMTISERNGKLYGSSNRMRLPGKLRITHIVMEEKKIVEYVGYLQTEDKKIPFRCPRVLSQNEWLRRFCLQHKIYVESLGYTRITEAVQQVLPDNLDFFQVAMVISPPAVIIRRSCIGWDGEKYSFQNLTITRDGIVVTPMYEHALGSPGPQQTSIRQWLSLPKNTLVITPELTAAWSVIIALAAQLTAEPAGLPVAAVQVRTPNRANARRAKTLLKRLAVTLDEKQRRHKWPSYPEAKGDQLVSQSLLYAPYTVLIQNKQIHEAVTVDMPQEPLSGVNMPTTLHRVLPAYLTFIMTRHHIPDLSTWQDLLTYTVEALCLLADDPDGVRQIRNAARNVRLVSARGRLQEPIVHNDFI